MKDMMEYETPFGFFGSHFNKLALKQHLTHFLIERNAYLKFVSENRNQNWYYRLEFKKHKPSATKNGNTFDPKRTIIFRPILIGESQNKQAQLLELH
jgi:hypothetical protein